MPTAIITVMFARVILRRWSSRDPLQPHLDMLRTFKDDDIHNLTAYLVTLK